MDELEENNSAEQVAPSETETEPEVATGESVEKKSEVVDQVEVDSVQSADSLFPKLADTNPSGETPTRDLSMIMDIPVQLSVELGRTRIPIKNILQLAQGSVVELDSQVGEPMDVLVNGCLIAQGEVVVVNEKFGVRLIDIVTPSERIKRMQRS